MAILEAGSTMLASHMQQAVSGTRNTFQSNDSTSRITFTFLEYWRMELVILPAYILTVDIANFAIGTECERGKSEGDKGFSPARL